MSIASEHSASNYENLHHKEGREARVEAAVVMPHQENIPCTNTGEDFEMTAILDQQVSKVRNMYIYRICHMHS